jgi:hypothetical protein
MASGLGHGEYLELRFGGDVAGLRGTKTQGGEKQ